MPLDLLAAKLRNCRSRRFVIHSDLTIFGHALPKYKGLLVESFRQKLDAEALAIPTFNLNTNPKSIIDFSMPDASMGAFPIEAISTLKDTNSLRLPNPIHSYTFFPYVDGLKKIDCRKSFGVNSIFDYFNEKDFYWVEFGTSSGDGLTIFHHLEYLAAVPYREKIFFDRTIIFGNKQYTVTHEYYARKDNSLAQNFSRAENYLIDNKIITRILHGERHILVGSVKEISLSILAKLSSDPYFLVEKI